MNQQTINLHKSLEKYLAAHSKEDLLDEIFHYLAINSDFFENTIQGKESVISSFIYGNKKYQEIQEENEWEIVNNESDNNRDELYSLDSSYDNEVEQLCSKLVNEFVAPLLEEPSVVPMQIPEMKKMNQPQVEEIRPREEKHKYLPIPLPYYSAPIGNGGITRDYSWNQSLNEVQVNLTIPSHLKSKDLVVYIGEEEIKVTLRWTGEILFNKKLKTCIKNHESYWMIESNRDEISTFFTKTLIFHLQKDPEDNVYWNCVFKGDPLINISQIVPSEIDLLILQDQDKSFHDVINKAIREKSFSENKILNKMARTYFLEQFVTNNQQ